MSDHRPCPNGRTRVDHSWNAEVFLTAFTGHVRELSKQTPSESERFDCEWLLSQYKTKYCDTTTAPESLRVSRAFKKFEDTERVCGLRNNQRIEFNFDGSIPDPSVHAAIHAARLKIAKILRRPDCEDPSGFSSDPEFHLMSRGFGFGPGASTRLGRKTSSLYYKLQGIPEVTLNCRNLLNYVDPRIFSEVALVEGNRLTTVPKSSDIDRVIAIEPDCNMFIQKGIGRLLRLKLRHAGLNLNTQTRNQIMALKGAKGGVLATVDLSSASDSVSLFCVKDLFPPAWYDLLLEARSECGSLDGRSITFEKISSMGNGYTFELESMIFWALALVCSELSSCSTVDVCTYGDDIIVEKNAVPLLKKVLFYYGFTFNDDKSFVDGKFRESCGKHYYDSRDVTPFYYRAPARTIFDAFLLHNNALRWYVKHSGGYIPSTVYDLFIGYRRMTGRKSRPAIPLLGHDVHGNLITYGDGAFAGTFDEVRPRKMRQRKKYNFPLWQEYYTTASLSRVSLGEEVTDQASLDAHLYSLEFVKPEPIQKHTRIEIKANTHPQYITDGRIGTDEISLCVQQWHDSYTIV